MTAGFFFRKVNTPATCTSQILLDGCYVTLDRQTERRTSSTLEIYPCQGGCCCGECPIHLIHKLPPYKLYVQLMPAAQHHSPAYMGDDDTRAATLILTLRRDNQLLQHRVDDIELSGEGNDLIPLNVELHPESCKLLLGIAHGRHHSATLSFTCTPGLYGGDARSEGAGGPGTGAPTQRRWLSFPLVEAVTGKKDTDRSTVINFDDRVQETDDAGNVMWPGLNSEWQVLLVGVRTWSFDNAIRSIQFTYDVNGRSVTAPRRTPRVGQQNNECDERDERVRLAPGEDIRELSLLHHRLDGNDSVAKSVITHLGMRTTSHRRTHTLGTSNRIHSTTHHASLTLPLSSSPWPRSLLRAVAAHGAMDDSTGGLCGLSIVIETAGTQAVAAVTHSLLRVCVVCGARADGFESPEAFEYHRRQCAAMESPALRVSLQPLMQL